MAWFEAAQLWARRLRQALTIWNPYRLPQELQLPTSPSDSTFSISGEMWDLIDDAVAKAIDKRCELSQRGVRRPLNLDRSLDQAWVASAPMTPNPFDEHRRGARISREQRRRTRAAAVESQVPSDDLQRTMREIEQNLPRSSASAAQVSVNMAIHDKQPGAYAASSESAPQMHPGPG